MGAYKQENQEGWGELMAKRPLLPPEKTDFIQTKRDRVTESGAAVDSPRQRKDKEVFRANLNGLLQELKLFPRDAAKRFEFPWRWFRQVSSAGVKAINRRSQDRLQRIADEFHIDVEQLWNPRLLEDLGLKGGQLNRLPSLKQHRYWEHAERLLVLLASGEHAYLTSQIDKLYALHRASQKRPSGSPVDVADEEDLKDYRRFGSQG